VATRAHDLVEDGHSEHRHRVITDPEPASDAHEF
jgi:hypothetical protein